MVNHPELPRRVAGQLFAGCRLLEKSPTIPPEKAFWMFVPRPSNVTLLSPYDRTGAGVPTNSPWPRPFLRLRCQPDFTCDFS